MAHLSESSNSAPKFIFTLFILSAIIVSFIFMSVFSLNSGLTQNSLVNRLPVIFEKNVGHFNNEYDFQSRNLGFGFLVKPNKFTLELSSKLLQKQNIVSFNFVGADKDASFINKDRLNSKSNYFNGPKASNWFTDIPNYSAVAYEHIYPGIDVKYYGMGREIEYDLLISPSADPEIIKLSVDGIRQLQINDKSNLELCFDDETLEIKDLLAYQEISGKRKIVEAEYKLYNDNTYGFNIGEYDNSRALIIDPVVDYSTYLGGNGSDQGNDIKVDSEGNAYIVGQTSSTDFPVSSGSFDETGRKGGFFDPADIFVTKLNADGSGIIYSTYISGGGSDIGYGIAVDEAGNAYVVGSTNSVDDPETNEIDEGFPLINPYQNFNGGEGDLVLLKLNPAGNELLFSTYFGGEADDFTGQDNPGIDLDGENNIYISGTTQSLEFPTTIGSFDELGPGPFISKFNNSGSSLIYSTFLGGDDFVFVSDLVVQQSGEAIIAGFTANPNLPTTSGVFQPLPQNGEEAFIYKLNSSGTDVELCTYFGGSEDDFAYGINLDDSGNIYFTGSTTSSEDFPLTLGSIPLNGSAYAAKLNSTGSQLIYSLSVSADIGYDIAVDYANRASIVGQYFDGSSSDVIFSVINQNGDGNIHETFFGGLFNDIGYSVDVDDSGNAYITGITSSDGFPGEEVVNQNPLLADLSSPPDGFVVKVDMEYEPIESMYISRQEAIDIFTGQYLETHPRIDSIASYLYNKVGPDSLLLPGDIVASYDSNFIYTVEEPSYFFWTDLEPESEFWHPTSFSIMNAVNGNFVTNEAFSWPVINSVQITEFMYNANLSLNIIFGANLFASLAPIYPYTPVERDNKDDWAVLLISKNYAGEREKRARVNDIARVKEILNGVEKGPKIDPENIVVITGEDTLGATENQLDVALNNIKGKACNKLYFFYLGHGNRKKGIDLADGQLKYEKLREKLAQLTAKEFCIIIEACYSGQAIPIFKKGQDVNGKTIYFKGKLITSSSSGKTTLRQGDGTPFYKAFNTCFKDSTSDLNKDGKIDIFEALAWAIALNEKVKKKEPKGTVLRGKENEEEYNNIFVTPKLKVKKKEKRGKLRDLKFYMVRGRFKPKYGGADDDRFYARAAVYVENCTNRRVNQRVIVRCSSAEDGEGRGYRDTVTINLPPFRGGNFEKPPRQCLTEMPPKCLEFRIKVIKNNEALLKTAADDEIIDTDTTVSGVVYEPGEYIFEPVFLDSLYNNVIEASVEGNQQWNLSIDPDAFVFPAVIDTQEVIVRGDVPESVTEGGSINVRIVNETLSQDENYYYNLLIHDPNEGYDGNDIIYELEEIAGDINITSGTLNIYRSGVVFPNSSSIYAGQNSELNIFESSVLPDTNGAYGISIEGKVNIVNTNFSIPLEGITINSADGSIYGGGVFGSEDDGLKIYNDQSNMDINFFSIIQSEKNGIYFDNAAGSKLRNVNIEDSKMMDLSLNNSSNVVFIDGILDKNKLSIDPTSSLERKWSSSILLTDADGIPIDGAVLTIKDLINSETIIDTTDTLGLSSIHTLTQFTASSDSLEYRTPHSIQISYGTFDTTVSVTAAAFETHEIRIGSVLTGLSGNLDLPDIYSLSQNYPNPFNPATRIEYSLPEETNVKVTVYNILGMEIKTLINENKDAGFYSIIFDASALSSGIYFYRIETDSFIDTKKMVYLK